VDISAIQSALRESQLDGWLFYYFHENDPLALRILGLDSRKIQSRRWFYLVPREGTPIKLVHRIEMEVLDALPGTKLAYVGWRELEQKLTEMLKGLRTVAMQYSPKNAIPYISRVDAGVIELVRGCGVEVASSADLVQRFEATWTDAQLALHVQTAETLRKIVFEAFAEIRRGIESKQRLTEYGVQQFICDAYARYGLTTSSPPIVAVNEHSGNPHYQPTAHTHADIHEKDLVLLDIWAKRKEPADAVYADITWTGYVGTQVPDKYTEVFNVVRGGRDAALQFVTEAVHQGREIFGWQVDDVARHFIAERGYGNYFIHRTGHSIGLEVHANGANIDNLETRDERRLIPRTAFSIEPGIYLPEFGIRSEIDVYISEQDTIVAGQPIQTEIIPILQV
jgi:Xaa-Pro aminopeptidase